MTERSAPQKSAEAYRTISEVAEDLDLPQHVLRFWETRFPQVRPLKRAGGRRFYRPEDVDLLRAVKALLYGEGYTIKGVQRLLRERGPRATAALANSRGPGSRDRVDPRDTPPGQALAPDPHPSAAQGLPWAEDPLEAGAAVAPTEAVLPGQDDDGTFYTAYTAPAEPLAQTDVDSRDARRSSAPDPLEDDRRAGVIERLDAVVSELLECARLLALARRLD